MFHVKVYHVSVLPHHRGPTMLGLSVCVCKAGLWQQRIWLLSGPWNCNSDLEVLWCLFIARSLGAWPYSLWHFQPLICRRIVMEYRSGVTLCSCHTIFEMAQRSRNPCGGNDATVGWNLALMQSAAIGGCSWVSDVFHNINRMHWIVLNVVELLLILVLHFD